MIGCGENQSVNGNAPPEKSVKPVGRGCDCANLIGYGWDRLSRHNSLAGAVAPSYFWRQKRPPCGWPHFEQRLSVCAVVALLANFMFACSFAILLWAALPALIGFIGTRVVCSLVRQRSVGIAKSLIDIVHDETPPKYRVIAALFKLDAIAHLIDVGVFHGLLIFFKC